MTNYICVEKKNEFSVLDQEKFTVHFFINKVRFWDVNIRFFLTAQIFRDFSKISKKRLKNIIIDLTHDTSLWLGKLQKY